MQGMSGNEKGLQRHIGVGTLVSSQERRAAIVPRINRLSAADKTVVNRTFCSLSSLHWISFVHACEETFKTIVYDALESKNNGCFLGEPMRRRPVLPGPAQTRRPAVRHLAPTRLWYVWVLDSTRLFVTQTHSTCDSGLLFRNAKRLGIAWQSTQGNKWFFSRNEIPSFVFLRDLRIHNQFFRVTHRRHFQTYRTFKDLSSPKHGHTTGGSCQGCAWQGRRGGAGQDGTPTDRFAQETTVPLTLQSIKHNCPERFFRSTDIRSFYVHRWKNKNRR